MIDYIMIITTTDSKDIAETIAGTLIGEKLAACVQILPEVESFYTWKGKVERSEEYLLFIKSRKTLYDKIEERIKTLHNYEVPEIIALPIEKGHSTYLKWIDDNTC